MKKLLTLFPAGLLIAFCLILSNLPEHASASNQAQLDSFYAAQNMKDNRNGDSRDRDRDSDPVFSHVDSMTCESCHASWGNSPNF